MEQSFQRQKKIRRMAAVTAKWWADRISGQVCDLIFSKETIDKYKLIKICLEDPITFQVAATTSTPAFVNGVEKMLIVAKKIGVSPTDLMRYSMENSLNDLEKKNKNNAVSWAQRELFEANLNELIVQEIEKNGFAYLHSDRDGTSCNILSYAGDRSGIDCGKDGVFTFAEYVDMFVDADKVVARFDKVEKYEEICNSSSSLDDANKNMGSCRQGKEFIENAIFGNEKDRSL